MPERLRPSHPPDLMHEAVGPSPELARRNMRLAWGLVGIFVILFGGTFGVGLVYLWLS